MSSNKSTIIVTGTSRSFRFVPLADRVTHAVSNRGLGLATVKVLLEELDANVVAIVRGSNQALDDLKEKHSGRLVLSIGDVCVIHNVVQLV